MSMQKIIMVRIRKELIEKLKILKEKDLRSVTWLVDRAIKNYLISKKVRENEKSKN